MRGCMAWGTASDRHGGWPYVSVNEFRAVWKRESNDSGRKGWKGARLYTKRCSHRITCLKVLRKNEPAFDPCVAQEQSHLNIVGPSDPRFCTALPIRHGAWRVKARLFVTRRLPLSPAPLTPFPAHSTVNTLYCLLRRGLC